MIALIQRVTEAAVTVDSDEIASIGHGILALIAAERDDSDSKAHRLADRILGYRLFGDEQARMNRSVRDIGGGVLAVPQFTLAADTRRGNRPGFSPAADPETARALFDAVVDRIGAHHSPLATGRFGADMQITSTNDGPVTFWLEC